MLPDTLRMDAWWLSDDFTLVKAPSGGRGGGSSNPLKSKKTLLKFLLATLCLIGFADQLIYGHELGLGLIVFTVFLSIMAIILRRSQANNAKHELSAIGVMFIGLLPTIEYVQALSMMFFILGCLGFVTILNGGTARFTTQIMHTCKFWLLRFACDIPKLRTEITQVDIPGFDWKRFLAELILPVCVGLIFILLFTSANPVLEAFTKHLNPLKLLNDLSVPHVLFWVLVLVLIWPFMRFVSPPTPRTKPILDDAVLHKTRVFFTQASVRKTLIVSNFLFLIQGSTDIGYLFAGADLPDGMTYAHYVHRGAYPLLATALLAGTMTVAFSGFARSDKLIRYLTIFWMVQTLALLGSSVFRLALYIDAYGLTLLRIWAAIWMGLVLVGIGLVILQILQAKPISWLVKCNMALAAVTLYVCCFFNFTHFVASYNFAHLDTKKATQYACELGDGAALAYFQTYGLSKPTRCFQSPLYKSDKADWRTWSFRKSHVASKLISVVQIENERLPKANDWRYGYFEDY
ncbi:MAG: hypothetical protein COB84_02580 [Rhodobacteraceae bacterium]|nr:MAG: hypothetical protein COB84_02580 [Paracoccaceae bacterium]